MKTCTVIGASGFVGGELIQILVNSGKYEHVYEAGRKKRVPDVKGTEFLETNFSDVNSLRKSILGEDIFCCLGTTHSKAGSKENFRKVDFDYVLNAGKAAIENGAKRFFLVSSVGANPKSFFHYTKVKGEVEQAILSLGFESTFIFRPSMLLGNRQESRIGERISQKITALLSPLLIWRLRKFSGVHAKDVAQAFMNVADSGLSGIHFFESDAINDWAKKP